MVRGLCPRPGRALATPLGNDFSHCSSHDGSAASPLTTEHDGEVEEGFNFTGCLEGWL